VVVYGISPTFSMKWREPANRGIKKTLAENCQG